MRSLIPKIFTASLCTGVGAYTYYSKAYSNQLNQVSTKQNIFDESKLSAHFKNYIKDNGLETPFFCDKYQKSGVYKSFLEQTIIKDINGLDYYNIYLDQDYQDELMKRTSKSQDEQSDIQSNAKLYCIFIPNENISNSFGVVHPGFISTLFDSLGAYLSLVEGDFVPPVTAYLNVKYDKPMNVGQEYVSIIEIEKMHGRKVFVNAKICDKDGNVYNSMESLYVKTKFDNPVIKELLRIWTGFREEQILKRLYKGGMEKYLQW